ncbi:hypothetical protein [Tenacibaculum aquimarinum]|uniref:hypothetical protein n=1 Tax=Tenacibaculum aquimarinum TaxID=2910675 RepID=UPI001F0AF3CE|nr:hypothetical protein [Tenacibaculum aquimarinum]MCH3881581.1 hypothetical protein [Tenacibaculum aquimarinum]
MKKIILVLAFVFATGSLVNANSKELNNKTSTETVTSCFDIAYSHSRAFASFYNLSDETRSEIFNNVYSQCLDQLF